MNCNLTRLAFAVSACAFAACALTACGGGGDEGAPGASASSSASDPSIADIAPPIPYGQSLASRDVQARETHQTVYVQGQGQ